MPIALNNSGPPKNSMTPITDAAMQARRVMEAFSAAGRPRVKAINMDTAKNGASRNRKRMVLLIYVLKNISNIENFRYVQNAKDSFKSGFTPYATERMTSKILKLH